MTKIIRLLFLPVLITAILFGCAGMNTLKYSFNTNSENTRNHVKDMFLSDNYKIFQEDSLTISTDWRKASVDDNNIPDYSIECKLEATVYPTKTGSEIFMKVMKRSSLDSNDPNTPSYTDIGVIANDLLYKKWNEKLKKLQQEFK